MATYVQVMPKPVNFVERALESVRGWFTRAGLTVAELDRWITGARPTAARIDVSETSALNFSAVWCGVQIIAGAVGSLPLILYKRVGDDGKERYTDHPLYTILHDAPNPEMTAMVFRETLQAHILLWGNGYAEIERDQAGRVAALWPLTPNRVRPRRDERTDRLYYEVSNYDGGTDTLLPSQILHIPGLGFDGVCGYSVIRMLREVVGLGLAAQQFGATFFGNQAIAGGVLEHPRGLHPDVKKALKEELDAFRGRGAGGTLLLENGMTWRQTMIPPDDAQFLETRKFQVVEVARILNLPPHMLKDLERATFSNIEHQSQEFVTGTLRPWLVRWEQEILRKLIAPSERKIQFAEHLLTALLRGDTESRFRGYALGSNWGWMSINDIRRLENMNPVAADVGDVYRVPLNMVDAAKADEIQTAQARPEPPPEPEPEPEDDEVPEDEQDAERAPTLAEVQALVQAERQAVKDDLRGMVEDLLRSATVAAVPPSAPGADPPLPDQPAPGVVDTPPAPPSRRGDVLTAQRQIIAGIARRMLARERDKARAASKTPERLLGWIEEFYARHAEVYRHELDPAIRMHCGLTSDPGDPADLTRSLVADYITESKRQLYDLLGRQPADLRAELDAMFERWEIERTGQIADAILLQEIDHA